MLVRETIVFIKNGDNHNQSYSILECNDKLSQKVYQDLFFRRVLRAHLD